MDKDDNLTDGKGIRQVSPQTPTVNEKSWSSCRIMKNVLCSSCGVFFIFIGFEGISHLQSTMNHDEGMGVASEAVIYAVSCLSLLLLPKMVIRKLGCKLTLILSLVGFCPYLVSNFYPQWFTLIPTAVLLGVAAALMWPSVSTYQNRLSMLYKEQTKAENAEYIRALFFSILGIFLLLSQVFGNLVSFLVLENQNPSLHGINNSECGIHFSENVLLPQNNPNLRPTSKTLQNILIGTLLCLSALAVLLVVFILDSLPKHCGEDNAHSLASRLTSTFKVMRRKNQLLLMPLGLYHGMQKGFYMSDFTKVYIACAWGVQHIGLVTTCFGCSAALFAIASGGLRKYIGRISFFMLAAIANVATFVLFFIWIPDPKKPFLSFVCPAVWSIFHGIYTVQFREIYGHLFNDDEEAAFANLQLWVSFGHFLSFSYSKHLIITTKIYILISVFCLGQVGYAYMEYGLKKK